MQGLLDTIRKLGMVRVVMLAGVAAGLLAMFAWIEFQGQTNTRMTQLAGELDARTSQRLVAALNAHKIPFQQDGNRIMVAERNLSAARGIVDADPGLSGGGDGYEIFDRADNWAATDFDQQVKLTRALEGELARTIASVPGITRARVHLVLPRREPFSHDALQARASVMISVPGKNRLSPEAVQSVVNLIASGVPRLRPQDITLVDSNLHLLYQGGDSNNLQTRSATEEDIRQRTESRLSQSVELMLGRTLGPGHVHAEASIQMNFDKVNETQEKYDPDGQVVRSTQNVTANNKTTDKTGPVSLQNNLPNADAGATTTGSQEGRQEETTNYEIGKTVRAVVHDAPKVERITLAVMVDGTDEAGADGKHTWKPREQAELDRIAELVKSAVGFDEKRGDKIDVVSMPFVAEADQPDTAPARKTIHVNSDLARLLQLVALGIVGFGIIILTARSIFAALRKPAIGVTVTPDGQIAIANGPAGPSSVAMLPRVAAAGGAIPGGGAPLGIEGPAAGGEHETVSIANVGGQVRASSLHKVRELVNKHPDTALAIIRGWMAEDRQ